MAETQENFWICPKQIPALKIYHLLSCALILALILFMPITLIGQIGLGLLLVAYGWFAWPKPECISFDARLNQQHGHLTLKSALHLFIGWRLQLQQSSGDRVIWVFDGQLSPEEHLVY